MNPVEQPAEAARSPRGISSFGRAVSALVVLGLAGIFASYLVRNAGQAMAEMGGWKVALFVGLLVLAIILGRAKESHKRLYGGLAVFFGLGATWDAVSKARLEQTPLGVNIRWDQMGLVIVAVLVVADGIAMWRSHQSTRVG